MPTYQICVYTVYNTSNNPIGITLQRSVDTAISWSKLNNLNINTSKTKDMLVRFAKEEPELQHHCC